MRHWVPRLVGIVGATTATAGAIAMAAVAPALAGDPCYHGFALPEGTIAATTQVKALECAFAPTIATVPVGATVSFVNGPEVGHLVTGANQEWGSRDEELAPGSAVAYAFAEPGIYPYACALHRGMTGTIVVGDGGPALAAAVAAGTRPATAVAASGATAPSGSTGSDTGSPDAAIGVLVGLAGLALATGVVVAARRRRRDRPRREVVAG